MAEEAATIHLDVNDIITTPDEVAVEAETTTPESSTEEPNAEATTSEEEPTEGKETEAEESEEAEEAPEESETEETPPDEPKNKSAEGRIRNLVAENRALREEVALKNAEAYKPATAQELVDQGMDEVSAKLEAMEQRQQLSEFNAQVAEVQMALATDANQVLNDFPMFNEKSSEYNPELAKMAETVYKQSAGIQQDPKTGLIYNVSVLPYSVYESIANAYSSGASTGQVKAQRSAEKMLASVDAPTSAAPKDKKTPFEGFDPKYRAGL